MKWHVYILQCADGTLYTGSTTDIQRRLSEHNSTGKGAKYTRSRQPVELVFSVKAKDRSAAAVKEAALKKMTRTQKLELINTKPRQKVVL